MNNMTKLDHKTVYEKVPEDAKTALTIPLIPELQRYHNGGKFFLLEDPRETKQTSIVGMFVLRPADDAWKGPVESVYEGKKWSFNIPGLPGGWLIANGNAVDAYRLALQYALADAVIVGSGTVLEEGVPKEGKPGYVWHPYNPTSWPQVAEFGLLEKVQKQREVFQKMQLLDKKRIYPAQIVVNPSGIYRGGRDVLEATIFHTTDNKGNPIEAYILTSKKGAERLRERAEQFGLAEKIDKILITLSPASDPEQIDYSQVPKVLFNEYDINIANHDGGRRVLKAFSEAGILPQMNLTLTRQKSLREVLEESNDERVQKQKGDILNRWHEPGTAQLFFGTGDGSVPKELVPVQIIQDDPDEVAVVTFDSRKARGF